MLLFPGMEIQPVEPAPASAEALARWHATDWAFFVSGNAVRHGLPHLPDDREPGRPSIAAVGASTAQALLAAGFATVLRPCGSEDSEGLLACPELQYLHGQQVLIIRGIGGRDVLAQGLRRAGATVAYAEVYARVAATQPVEPFQQALASGDIAGICAMSTETIHNLFDRLGEAWHAALCRCCWIVPHPRVAQAASALGIRQVVQAAGSSDVAVLRALQERYPAPG